MLTSINEINFKDSAQLLQAIKLIGQYEAKGKWGELLNAIKNPLRKATGFHLTTEELVILCEDLTKIRQFDAVVDFVKRQPHWRDIPLLAYYFVNAKIKGNVNKMKDPDYDLLEAALDKAQQNKDIRAAILIDKLLTEAIEDDELFSPDMAEEEVIAQIMAALNSGARPLFEKIRQEQENPKFSTRNKKQSKSLQERKQKELF